ncbi:type I 3-dehydroquinate dehydratase [Proteiniclasticum sp. SCR006]|uniref:3-dehydroquinate dehydratase n=1 Tax=Proteiniclasticum aestuarii TaxID=2817862 RepID=A0A939H7Y1_9CLOT|nr:type I 3-dehydroquinate dehydratase [Proteiniclasticum aestuarii]MBO1263643.1 type I 3-dehydroquinate dehydratase [Proteiniclasticum aestuarii]
MKPLKIGDVLFDDGAFNVCITLTPGTVDELRKDLYSLKGRVFRIIEWRADYLLLTSRLSEEIEAGLRLIKEAFPEKPLIFTYRWKEEGGQTSLEPKELYRIRREIVEQNLADIMDIEMYWFRNAQNEENLDAYFSLVKEAKGKGMKVLLSWHDFSTTPDEEQLLRIFRTQEKLGADLAKIAVAAVVESDLDRLMKASFRTAKSLAIPHIALSMGDLGKKSRYDRKKSMSSVTFAPVHNPSAPGQLPLDELQERLNEEQE